MKKSVLITILMTAFVSIFQVFETKAAPGDYDSTFGIGGVSEHQVSESTHLSRLALQKDGKILVAGYQLTSQTYRLILRRHSADGSLDTSFGNQGEAVEQVSPNNYRYIQSWLVSEIAVQPDGKILIGGDRRTNNHAFLGLSVWRFSENGFLDKTFDGDGRKDIVTSTVDPTARVQTIKMTKSVVSGATVTKILALCTFDYPNEAYAIAKTSAIYRLTTNGGTDTNFGIGGKVGFKGEFKHAAAYKPAVSITGDVIYVAGADHTKTPTIWRLTDNGAADANFADAGKFVANIGANSVRKFRRVIVQPDDKLLVTGDDLNWFSGPFQTYILRLSANGTPDSQFGNTILPNTNISGTYNGGYQFDMGLQTDGKIISGFHINRYLLDGTPDTSFDLAYALNSPFILQRDNKLVALEDFSDSQIYVLRRTLPN